MMNKLTGDYSITLSDGRKLGFAEYGDSLGKPLFFFHGWPSSRMHAKRMHQAAKKLKTRIISMDRPGFGLSDFKPNRTLLDFPDDVAELATYLRIKKFAIVGISGGGPYAAVTAYKIPQRITKAGIVVGLAPTYIDGILDGLAFINKIAWANYGRLPFLRDLSSLFGLLEYKVLPFPVSHYLVAKVDRKLINKSFRELSRRSTRETYRQGFKGPAMDLKLYTNDWGFDLAKIKVPVYLWYGDQDKNVSLNMAKYYASQIRGSKLTIYPNEGHYLQITHAHEILRTLTS